MAAPANNPFGAPPQQVQNNPFGAPVANPFGAPVNNPFGAPASGTRPSSAGNPFGTPSGQTSVFGTPAASAPQSTVPSRQPSPSIQNPSGKPPPQGQQSNPFATAQSAFGSGPKSSSFGSQAQPPAGPKASRGFDASESDTMARKSKSSGGNSPVPNSGGFGGRGQNRGAQGGTPFANIKSTTKQPNGQPAEGPKKFQPGGRNKKPKRQDRHQPAPRINGVKKEPTREPTERTKQLSKFAFDYANKLYAQLKKDNISPPQMLAEPGDPSKRGAVENLKEAYKKYRNRVYASLRKADLIDDPEKRRKLEDALPFKGICEDMCPEFEQVSRIAEYDVKTEEKETRPDGLTMWPDPSRMVKKFGRSAAGQDAPLPMDVRSVDALRRTTDYLFNDLLQSESNLPSMHNFLWDRTRAVRKDFTFHSQKTAEEMKDMVYCFETITRFHATALHLLSRKGFANEDFDQKQEIEQLGRTILSLMEAYDVCRDKRVPCENEAEFRAYYLLLNAGDPSIAKRIPAWGKEFWFESEEVQIALSLINVMDDIREPKGPIKPRRPTTLGDTSFTNYFSIVEDPRVSYTMACIAEIHFTTVRQGILKNLVGAYARRRDAPRTITASDLNAMLRFDTDEEAIEFAQLHKFEFTNWVPEGKNPVSEPYLLLDNKKQYVPSPRVKQSFSQKLVERKRSGQSLPYVIYNTIFEEPAKQPPSTENSPDGLFVSQSTPFPNTSFATPSTSIQPAAASPLTTAMASPFSFTANKDTASPPALPSTSGPVPAAAPSFAQPLTNAAPSPFGAFGQPTPQAPAEKSPFSFPNQPAFTQPAAGISGPKTSTGLGLTSHLGAATAFPFSGVKASESPNPLSSLKDSTSTQPFPPAQPAQQAAPASTPSLLGGTFTTQPKDVGSTGARAAEPAPSAPKPASTLSSSSPLFQTASDPKPAAPQPASTTPAVPTISVTSPSEILPPASKENAQLAPSQVKQSGSGLVSEVPKSALSFSDGNEAIEPKPLSPSPERDLMGDFTRWFVTGDGGLMEQFTEEALRNLLWDVFQDFTLKEAARKRREEDEESWRLARQHQIYRLRVKYFYRWRNKARALATKRILREGKEKMRLYREQQRIIQQEQREAQEKAEREARRAAKRQVLEDGRRLSMLVSSARARRPSVAYSADHNNPEEQLLASGVFAGIRDDPRGFARRVVREAVEGVAGNIPAAIDGWRSAAASPSRSFQYHPYAESELSLEPARESIAASPDSSSVASGKREGWKTRSLRERFGVGEAGRRRNSLSAASGSVVLNGLRSSSFRQSLPPAPPSSSSVAAYNPNNRVTNFSRMKRKSAEGESDDEPGAKRLHHQSVNGAKAGSGFARSRHWDLRIRGLVPTPDGKWLPEAIAKAEAKPVTAANTNITTADVKTITTKAQTEPPEPLKSKPTPPGRRRRRRRRRGSLDDDPDYVPSSSEEDDDEDRNLDLLAAEELDNLRDAAGSDRAPSPSASPSPSLSPSDLRQRLARLKKSSSTPQRGRVLPSIVTATGTGAGTGAQLLGRTSPLHPPPLLLLGKDDTVNAAGGKRKRGLVEEGEMDVDADGDGAAALVDGVGVGDGDGLDRMAGARKRPNHAGGNNASVDLAPGRDETRAMVENTRRMLRELREAMDRLDGENGGGGKGKARAGVGAVLG
ncbi:hypothetical protein VTK26DRAFT_7266 [Humicola hyalothermophila]